ncbi:myelin-oligodendrocyte glycoprotein-like isoform X2 [Grus americana]|uniref:myelin-oligodendrocyte glycoprotein-like isoform X2 n=1 Tax=Grus americana TaxID=9117 RepID=UPI002407F6D1|nr:myelin-oligodendrocyte glycoprotein-like isoform X2 [Grus americana]
MWLLLSYLVTLHVLRLGSADFSVVGPGRPLQVTVGQDVVLPCHLSPSMDTRSLDIRWIRPRFSKTAHHYRNGEDLYSEQLREYVGRTEVVRDGLSRGRLDLRISGLRPSDDGQYVCTVTDGASYGEAMVDVEVSAPFFHNARPWMVGVGVVLLLLVVFLGLAAYLWRRKETTVAGLKGECL